MRLLHILAALAFALATTTARAQSYTNMNLGINRAAPSAAPVCIMDGASCDVQIGVANTATGAWTLPSTVVIPSGLTIPAPILTGAATFTGSFIGNLMATPDIDVTAFLATAKLGVANDAGYNSIVGAGVTRASNIFPTAVTAYWKMPFAGGTGFGLFARCDLYAAGSCNNEMNAFNYIGAPPVTPPGSWAFGTADHISVALHLGAAGTFQPGIALSIGPEGAVPQRFQDGIYFWASQGPTARAIFIDATATDGPINSMLVRNTGQGANVHLQLQTMGATVTSNAVIQHLDSGGTQTWALTQGGSGIFTALTQAPELLAFSATYPNYRWNSSGNALNQKAYDAVLFTDGVLHFRAVSDDGLSANDWMTVSRSAATPTGVNIVPALTLSAAPIMSTLTGYLKGNGASALTAAATVPLSDLATQATNTLVGNATAGSAAPTALAIGSCSTSASALQWTTNTGFGCNTAIDAATLGGATFAAPGAIGGGTPGTGAFTTVTATSVNKVAITAPATSATLTLADGSTLATSGAFSTTLTATAITVATLPAGTHSLAPLDSPSFTTPSVTGGLALNGATSGAVTLKSAAVAGTNTITFPAGTTDFSATGGTSQVLQQASAGAAITVGQLAASNLSNGVTGTGAVVLAASPTVTGTLNAGAIAATANSSVTLSQTAPTLFTVSNQNSGASAQAQFIASTDAGNISLAASGTGAGTFSNLQSTINGVFYVDAIGASAGFHFRTGAGPTDAIVIDASQNTTFATYVKTGAVAVASLPACAAGTKGARYFVTDANATTFLSTVAAGGANNVPVVCDGTNWVIG